MSSWPGWATSAAASPASLHDLGVDVVCVDRDENAAGISLARQLGLRVVIGETPARRPCAARASATSQALVLGDHQRHREPGDGLCTPGPWPPTSGWSCGCPTTTWPSGSRRRFGNAISRSVPYLGPRPLRPP